MKSVTFLSDWMPYHKGDGANFPDATAESLVKKGLAEYQDGKAPPKRATATESMITKSE